MLKVIRKMADDGWFIYGTIPTGTPKPAEWEAIAACSTPEQAQAIAAEYGRSEMALDD